MAIAATFTSLPDASAATEYLLRSGIVATAIQVYDIWKGPSAQIEVEQRDLEKARTLIEEFNKEKIGLQDNWEEQTLPNLAALDPSLAPACPGCNAKLPLDAALTRCPACGAAVDVVALIIARHGPEALDACYAAHDPMLSEDELTALRSTCSCGYSLLGLPRVGVCPECAAPYDKLSPVFRNRPDKQL